METAIVLGTFDGLHSGHLAVIEKATDLFSVAVTFEIPPKCVVSGKTELLILPQDRQVRLKKLGVEYVEMQNFDDVRNITAEDYLQMLKEKYRPARVICGFNYRFGKDAAGDVKLLEKFCNNNNIELCCVPAQYDGNEIISSTKIREHIKNGEIKKASQNMYGGFSFEATVLHGDARGRTIGFPTANQDFPELLVKPKFGVYLSNITVDGKTYRAVTNIGIRPTYKTDSISCETYIKNFKEDIYGKIMRTQLIDFVREEKKFNSLEELKKAIEKDVALLG